MNLVEHDSDDYGFKVWLSQSEVETLLDSASSVERRIAFSLAARCGLRTKEVLEVAPSHVVDTDAGTMLRVHAGKGDKYRETPVPSDLATTIRAADDYREDDSDTPIIPITTTSGLRKVIERRRDKLATETGDDAWRNVSWHDLRRTWASALSDAEVSDRLVMAWGGWEDLETFLDHYEGKYSPEAQRREREKVEWL